MVGGVGQYKDAERLPLRTLTQNLYNGRDLRETAEHPPSAIDMIDGIIETVFVSAVHTTDDIDRTIAGARTVFAKLK